MQAEDFSVWLAAISGMSAAQRTEGLAALEKAADAASGDGNGRQAERGCARNDWGRAGRAPGLSALREPGYCRLGAVLTGFSRYRCKACRRTFNALQLDADGASAQEGEAARPTPRR